MVTPATRPLNRPPRQSVSRPAASGGGNSAPQGPAGVPGRVDEQPNLNLARGLTVLEAFTTDGPEWGIRELARYVGVNPTSVHRLVTTLLNMGYLERSPSSSRYRLGPKVVKLSQAYRSQNDLRAAARDVFKACAGRFAYSFYLGVLSGYDVVYTATHEGEPLRVSPRPGGKVPLYSTAMGKVLLAFQPDEFVRDYVRLVPLVPYTSTTLVSGQKLWSEIQDIRRSSVAFNSGEHYAEIGAIAAAVRDESGVVVAGVSLSYPMVAVQSGRLDLVEVEALARDMAAQIETALAAGVAASGEPPRE